MPRTRKGSTPDHQQALPLENPATRVLPMQLRAGDVVFDANDADCEVVTRPVGIAKKHVIAHVRVPGRPETEKEERWEVHERGSVRRRDEPSGLTHPR